MAQNGRRSGFLGPPSLAATIAMLLYSNTVSNGFVFDDHRAIEGNIQVQTRQSWASLLTTDFWGTPLTSARSHHSYRPLAVMSLRADAIIAGGRPALFHAVNALLHAANTWLVWLHAADALQGRSAALAAALLFAAHPVNSEAVAYCVGRADLLAAMFGLAGLRLHTMATSAARGIPSAGHRSTWPAPALRLACVCCLTLALASKETSLVLLPACVVNDLVQLLPRARRPRRITTILGAVGPGWLCLSALAGGYVWLRALYVGPIRNQFRRLDNPIPSVPTAAGRTLACAHVHVVGASLLLWPASLSADYS